MVQSSKLFIAWSTIRWQRSSLGLRSRSQRPSTPEMWTRAKLCLLRYSNCWETGVMENVLRRWSSKQAWSTQRMWRWWTKCCEARTSIIWKSSGKHASWKAGMLELYYDFLDQYLMTGKTWVDSDRRRQQLHCHFCWFAWGHLLPRVMQNWSQQSSSGLHGTSGVGACQGCSDLNVKAAGWLHYVQSATMLMNKTAKKEVQREGNVEETE